MSLSYQLTRLIEDNKIELIEELLAAGLSLESNSLDYRPLKVAIYKKKTKIVETLINAGCDLNLQDEDGKTPLMYALHFSRLPEISKLLINAGANIRLKDIDGNTALVYAIAEQETDIADLIRSRENELKLIEACDSLDCEDQLIRDLLATGVNVNAFHYKGYSALMSAALARNRSQIKLLIEAGADINMRTRFHGKTALMFSIAGQQTREKVSEITLDLLAAGADPDIKDNKGETAHDLVADLCKMYPNHPASKELVEILKLFQNKKGS